MRVMALSVHPDDETLGCGGTLLRHRERGDTLYWLIVTQGYAPRCSAEMLARKVVEIDHVADAYGFAKVTRLGHPSAELETVPFDNLIDEIRQELLAVRPEVVYLVNGGDVHTDHQVVYKAAMSILKPFHLTKMGIKRVLAYETLSSTDAAYPPLDRMFQPNVYHDITAYLEQKLTVMALYASEQQVELLPRSPSSIRALARLRGATIGVEFAEVFMLIRDIIA